MTLETDLQSLASDATVWDDSSDTLANAAFVSRAAELVNQGRLETASMADGLRQVRDG